MLAACETIFAHIIIPVVFLQHQWGRVLVNLSPVQLLQGDLTNQRGQQGFTCQCWRPMHVSGEERPLTASVR